MALLRRSLALGGLVGTLLGAPPAAVRGQALLTQEEALAMAFGPEATLERRTAYLDEEQAGRIATRAGTDDLEQRVVTWYEARRDGRVLGTAWFDAHRVRTLPEVLMIVVEPDGTVGRIEVLRFAEPPEYRAPEGWLEQFEGRELEPGLSTRGDIVGITGATLTSNAVTAAVRRTLALHGVLAAGGAIP